MYYKRYVSLCDVCLNMKWSECECVYYCGNWRQHKFKDIPYPKQDIIMQERSAMNTITNNTNNGINVSRPVLSNSNNVNNGYDRHRRDVHAFNQYSPYNG